MAATNEEATQLQDARVQRKQDFRDPKKHYVRRNGWLPVLREYARLKQRRVKYLTLCSKEAIDVLYFAHKGCLYRNAERNIYPSLTFVESNPEDYAAIAELLGRVRYSALGRLEDVILENTHECHGEMLGTFPHDVINLDFCGDILPSGDHPYNETLRCIVEVIRLQCTKAPEEPWHLFLTFRAQPAMGSQEANDQLAQQLRNNIEARAELREAYGGRNQPEVLVDENYAEFLRIGVSKLLAYAASHQGFRLESESSFVYGRHGGQYRIVTIIAKLSPFRQVVALPDPAQNDNAYGEAVRRIFASQAVDVDAELDAAEEETVQDLQPIIDEVRQLGVVTA